VIYHAPSGLKNWGVAYPGFPTQGSQHCFAVRSPWAIDILPPSGHFDRTILADLKMLQIKKWFIVWNDLSGWQV